MSTKNLKMSIKKKTHLKEAQKLYKKLRSSEKVAKELSEKYETPYTGSLSRKIRFWLEDTENKEEPLKKIEESEEFKKALKRKVGKSKYRIITSAQNATPVHAGLLRKIKLYANFLDAEINVIPIRYHNPTSVFKESVNEYWAPEIQDLLIASRQNIHPNVVMLADIKMQPTASMPLTGLEGLTGEESSVIAHPRQHFKTVPTLRGQKAKFLLTTGSITEKNYTDSKVGKKGEFHHTFGFVIVETLDDETFFTRHVSAEKNGDFYDLDYRVTDAGVVKTKKAVISVVFGDIHLGSTDPFALEISNTMLERFKPKHVIFHDIMDGASVSHHERQDPFISLEREQDNTWRLDVELDKVVRFVGEYLEYTPIIVKSNHDIFVDRWLTDVDWRKEKNKYCYLKYGKLKADKELPNGILPYELKQAYGNQVICLTDDDSFKINGIELAVHGHLGASGSRGTGQQFKKLNTKLITGHTHSPLKLDNLLTVGTLTFLKLEYTKGMSAWYHANALVHENGKTQLLLIHGEKGYTTL